MLTKFLDPKNDVAFKRIFGSEKNKDILIHFLNDMLTFKEKGPIVDVTFLKTVQDPETAAKKTSIVDILCRDTIGNTYIVEMQVAKEKGFEKRAQYYASKAYSSQADVGGDYASLKEIIFLAISDYVVFPDKREFKSDHVILDRKSHENDLKDFSFTFLELPKFKKRIDELEGMVDKWSYFFKHAEDASESEIRKIVENDQIMERAFHELDRFSWGEIELRSYDQAEKYEGAYRASMAQKYDEGLAQGIIQGIAEGRAEGRAEGELEGKLKTAARLLKLGLDLNFVMDATGLSKKDLEPLQPVQGAASAPDF